MLLGWAVDKDPIMHPKVLPSLQHCLRPSDVVKLWCRHVCSKLDFCSLNDYTTNGPPWCPQSKTFGMRALRCVESSQKLCNRNQLMHMASNSYFCEIIEFHIDRGVFQMERKKWSKMIPNCKLWFLPLQLVIKRYQNCMAFCTSLTVVAKKNESVAVLPSVVARLFNGCHQDLPINSSHFDGSLWITPTWIWYSDTPPNSKQRKTKREKNRWRFHSNLVEVRRSKIYRYQKNEQTSSNNIKWYQIMSSKSCNIHMCIYTRYVYIVYI